MMHYFNARLISLLPWLVLLYAVCSIGLLLAYQKTRLFPLYLLKCAWTGFTILAFIWVVAMSFAESKEYIQHPAGPFAIIVGEPLQNSAGITVLSGGYPDVLTRWTGTRPHWVVAVLFSAWMTWGLLRGEMPEPGGKAGDPKRRLWICSVGAVAITGLLWWGCGWRDAIGFGNIMTGWLLLAALAPRFFTRFGHWMLVGLAVILALPLIEPLRRFDWGRYGFALKNYRFAWSEAHIGQYFMNSLIVTITAVSMTTLLGAMAAYVLGRREFAGRSLVYALIIGAIAVPGILIQMPLFLLIKNWGFTVHEAYRYSFMDSRLGLAVIYTALALPFTIFVLTGFFRTLPGTLGEAAVIDGCGQWKTFTDIYLPLALPGIATTGIFNFLGAWNEFNLGMIFMSNPNFKTLPIGLYELQEATQFSSAWAPMFAGIVLLCLPTFLIFVFLQQRIVAGLTVGGVKG